ncbi:MAG: DUF4363 family protein [Clostridiales bacterium]|nr:DUF4363 family protein [Clostridiales bacterium]
MRSFVIAVFILSAIIGGLCVCFAYVSSASSASSELMQAAQLSLEKEDWEQAEAEFFAAKAEFRRYLPVLTLLIDEREIESVESQILVTEQYMRQKEIGQSLAGVAQTAFLLGQLQNRAQFSIANIF